ncbi:MAG: cupin domain-containing protein [Nitrospirae bacterium]|nr:MAG: cupin domain-containing protein [Nitrospirota bacterium]
MIVANKKPNFVDERGEITDIIENTSVNSITILNTKKGYVRANHYHKETTQYTYVIEGSFRYYAQAPNEETKEVIIAKGDLVISPPMESHAFEALEDSVLLACCQGPRMGSEYETDTFRVEVPLCLPKCA